MTAAGLVLAGTFLALAQMPDVTVAEVGLAVAIGVLVDTVLVRSPQPPTPRHAICYKCSLNVPAVRTGAAGRR
ncbi:MMPL family transporter [Actinomadura decatromicini]|uniref:MMPL family transporter n=1 Tax=Actinomadura decatromicini TaxID=2604572 RepID=UPI002482DE91|nr:MMPL family transporter [Actinomadura decatromicini]